MPWCVTGSGVNLPNHRIEIVAAASEVFVSDTDTGFFARAFDPDGRMVATIDRTASEAAVLSSPVDREALLEEIRPTLSPNGCSRVQADARGGGTEDEPHAVADAADASFAAPPQTSRFIEPGAAPRLLRPEHRRRIRGRGPARGQIAGQ